MHVCVYVCLCVFFILKVASSSAERIYLDTGSHRAVADRLRDSFNFEIRQLEQRMSRQPPFQNSQRH